MVADLNNKTIFKKFLNKATYIKKFSTKYCIKKSWLNL